MSVSSLTERLVAIDSVNPSLVSGAAGESEIARFISGWAEDNDLDAQLLEGTPGRPSVLVSARGSGGGRTLLLCGHTDTVNVDGMDAPHAPQARGRPPLRPWRVRHEGRPRCGARRRTRGGGTGPSGRRRRGVCRGRGALLRRRPRGAAPRPGRRGDRDGADRARGRRRAQGLRLGGDRHRGRRSARVTPASRRRRDRQGRTRPRRHRCARRAARCRHAPPDARARLGPRRHDRRRSRTVVVSRPLRDHDRAAHPARGDRADSRRRDRGPAGRGSGLRPRPGASFETKLVREPFTVDPRSRDRAGHPRRRESCPRRDAAARGRRLLGGRCVHRRRGHPDRDVRPGGGGCPRGGGVGQHVVGRRRRRRTRAGR